MVKLVAGGIVCALLVGCGSGGGQYTFGDSVRLSVDRDAEGALARIELALGAHPACEGTRVSVAWKGGAPRAILARRKTAGCRV